MDLNNGEIIVACEKRRPGALRKIRNVNCNRILRSKFPFIEWLPRYNFGCLGHDILAGFTVGLTQIPQGIAYAAVAGLPLQYGLYGGLMGCFVYCIFGTVKEMNIGPASILALMIQPHVALMGPDMAVLICFISGLIVFLLGFFRLGFLVHLFSYPVIAGFTSAAALNIGSSQVKSLFGMPGKSESFLDTWITVFKNLDQIDVWDTTLGVSTIVLLTLLREAKRLENTKWAKSKKYIGQILVLISLSRNVFAVLIGTILAYCLETSGSESNPFELTGSVKEGLPPFSLPPFGTTFQGQNFTLSDMVHEYGATIAFAPIVAMLETFATAKVFFKGKVLDGSQEMITLGLANFLGSFVSSMPVAGSLTRTAINNASGVRTPAGGIITGTMIILALSFLTSTFYYIPKATLAAVVICAIIYLIDVEAFVLLWKTKKLDLVVFLVTFLTCALYNLQYGILIGIVINLTFVLYSTARPKIEVNTVTFPQGEIYVVTPKISIYFPASEHLRETVLKKCSDAETFVVINAKYMGNIDVTVAKGLASLAEELKVRNQKIVFWKFKKTVMEVCLGINKELAQYFKDGDLKQIIKDFSTEVLPLEMDYTIQ